MWLSPLYAGGLSQEYYQIEDNARQKEEFIRQMKILVDKSNDEIVLVDLEAEIKIDKLIYMRMMTFQKRRKKSPQRRSFSPRMYRETL
jgi:hypothetical protein